MSDNAFVHVARPVVSAAAGRPSTRSMESPLGYKGGDGADWRVGFRQERDPAGADAPAPARSSELSGTLQVRMTRC